MLICVAGTFKNSFWGETLQQLPVFKVVYPVFWVAKTFENTFWVKTDSCTTCSKSYSRSDQLKHHTKLRHLKNLKIT
jgi:hypothetical protein